MAGPGDSYAKDTRAYNPDFAAAAGDEEEYDKKIKEVSTTIRSEEVQHTASFSKPTRSIVYPLRGLSRRSHSRVRQEDQRGTCAIPLRFGNHCTLFLTSVGSLTV